MEKDSNGRTPIGVENVGYTIIAAEYIKENHWVVLGRNEEKSHMNQHGPYVRWNAYWHAYYSTDKLGTWKFADGDYAGARRCMEAFLVSIDRYKPRT